MNTVKSVGGRLVVLNSIPFSIEEKRVLREMRIPRLQQVRELPEEALARAIKGAIDAAYTLIHGRGCYRTFRITGAGADRVTLAESDSLLAGSNMVRLLERCDQVTLMAATIGPQLEDHIDTIKETGVADAYYLDVVGGWMADYMADRVDSIIQSEIQRAGYGRTMRYSPGYGDWDLTHQAELLALLETGAIGVTCTESCILQPRKSVTAVIGWERK